MATLITIDSNIKKITNNLNGISIKLDKNLSQFSFEYAKLAQRNLRLQLTRNGTKWSTKTWRSIKAVKESKTRSVVKIRREGIWLDNAKPHWVSLKRGRDITKWVRDHPNPKHKTGKSRVYRGPRGGIKGGALWVTPTPFIDEALVRTQLRFRTLLKNKLARSFK